MHCELYIYKYKRTLHVKFEYNSDVQNLHLKANPNKGDLNNEGLLR